MRYRKLFLALLAVASTAAISVSGAEVAKDIYKGSTEDRLAALAAIQPGLGTIMAEYGSRFTNSYFAAKGGNWGLAQYQLHEMIEAQEVAETTRPARADALKSFEEAYLGTLSEAIQQKDFAQFRAAFDEAVAGCNGCHVGTDHAFIKYTRPREPMESYLTYRMKTEPKTAGKPE